MLPSLLSGSARVQPAPFDLYVSTSGSDSSGLGTQAAPWATIDGARLGIRARGLAGSNLRVNITGSGVIRGSCAFETQDGGSGINIVQYVYDGTPGGISLRASSVVTGWTLHSGGIYKAFVGQTFRTLFEDGVRARQARYPKYVASGTYPAQRGPYLRATGTAGSHTSLVYGVGELSPNSWDITAYAPSVVIWSGGNFDWFTDTVPISAADAGTRTLTLSQQTRYEIHDGSNGSRYYIQGDLSMLTEAGEFAYDRQTGYVYYWPVGDIAEVTIEIPTAERVLSFAGSSEGSPVRNISIEGVAIEQSDFVDWYRHAYPNSGDSGESHQYPDYDRQMTLPTDRQGLVYLENAVGIQIARCHLKNAGMHGIYGHGRNAAHIFRDLLVENIGHSAGYFDGNYPGEGDVSFDCTWYNVKARDFGELAGNGAGLQLINSGNHRIRNCDFARGPRNGIFIGAYTDLVATDCYSRAIRVDNTRLTDLCQDSGDVGGLGIGGISSRLGGPYLTSKFRNIVIDNVNADPSMLNPFTPTGVFTDNQSWVQEFTNVQVTNVQWNTKLRINESGGHTVTNCSFLSDTSDNGAFDASAMEETGVTASFPVFA